jgi:hypothetical protein
MPPTEAILTTLINEIAAIPVPILLVLDDYHLVDEGPPVARLFYEALTRGIFPDYVRRLLAAFPIDESE